MTRWKRNADILLTRHAHHGRWSRWEMSLTAACDELGVPYMRRVYANRYDGSRSEDWLIPAGMTDRVKRTAEIIHSVMMSRVWAEGLS